MIRHRSVRRALCLILANSAACALGLAASDAAAQTAGGVEEVVVTATKRATLLQKTTETVQVLSANMMVERGVTDFSSYFLAVPSLSQSDNRGPGNTRYSLRGIQSGGEPLVAVYLDEIPLLGSPGETLDPGGSQPDIKLWDVERIEILKGPQGTLYGSGAAGGTIRIIAAKPKADAFDAAVQAELGSVAHGGLQRSVNAMVNQPLIEGKLALRASAYHYANDGYVDELYLHKNDANESEIDGGRLALRWTGETTTVAATGYYQKARSGADFSVFKNFGSDAPAAARLIRTPFSDEVAIGNLVVEQDLGWASVLYTGTYQRRAVERNVDQTRYVIFGLAGVPASVCPERALADRSCLAMVNGGPFGRVVPTDSYGLEANRSMVHELRLTSGNTGPFQWNVGYFHEDRDTSRHGQVAVTDAAGNLQFNAAGTANNRIYARTNYGSRQQDALFGEASYEFAPGLTLTGGLRWFNVQQTEQQIVVQNFFGQGPTGPQAFNKFSEDGMIGRAKLGWQVNDRLLVYALAAQGFRPGGPNQPIGFSATAPSYRSDQLWNYELGWKMTLGRDVTLNGAVYHIDWSNVQFVTTDATGAFTLIGNAGDVGVTGAELELQAKPWTNFEMSAGIGFNHARFAGAQPVQGLLENQTRSGDRLPGVPDWSTTLFAQYTLPLQNGARLLFNGDWAYRSGQTTGFRPDAGNFRDLAGYHVVNLRTGFSKGGLEVFLKLNNVFDARPEISGRIVSNEPFQYATLQPRTISISAAYHF
ncbi:MAG: hypothetical protein JWM77_119 [Rhodospirillales bacterium]|nr:hypothetical protein [Rhodospirillales bacterium]